MRALFGQCRTAKTAPRGTHSRTAARGTPPPGLSCFAWLPLLSVHNISLCADLCGGGISPGARGYFFGTVWWGERAKSVLLIPPTSCSDIPTVLADKPNTLVLVVKQLRVSSTSSLVPRQKTNSWQRDNYRMGIFMTKTLQEHNPQLSCFVLLGYKQLVANRF